MGEWLGHNRIESMGGYITEKREVWWIDVQVSILIEDLYNFPRILGCKSLRPPIVDCWHSLFVRTNTVFSSTINFWVSWLTILAYDETQKDRCVAEAFVTPWIPPWHGHCISFCLILGLGLLPFSASVTLLDALHHHMVTTSSFSGAWISPLTNCVW